MPASQEQSQKTHARTMRMISDYYHEGMSFAELGERYGISRQAVDLQFRKYHVTKVASQQSGISSRVLQLAERAIKLRSVPAAAKELGINPDTASWLLRTRGIKIKGETPEQRFWERCGERRDGHCWLWEGASHRTGYGIVTYRTDGKHKHWYAHRLAWYLSGKDLPKGPFELMHSCGVALCCNPDHLRIGTPADNGRDRVLHSQFGRGPDVVRKVLTNHKM